MAKLSRAVLEQAVEQLPDDTLTVYGVAREYEKHPNSVQRAIALGHLRAFKVGRQTLVWRDDAQAWCEK
jgi:hypothetical protein